MSTGSVTMFMDARACEVDGVPDEDEGKEASGFHRVTVRMTADAPFVRNEVSFWGTPAELFALAREIDKAVAGIIVEVGGAPWAITDEDGAIFDRFASEAEAREAMFAPPYSDGGFAVAFVNEPVTLDVADDGTVIGVER